MYKKSTAKVGLSEHSGGQIREVDQFSCAICRIQGMQKNSTVWKSLGLHT